VQQETQHDVYIWLIGHRPEITGYAEEKGCF